MPAKRARNSGKRKKNRILQESGIPGMRLSFNSVGESPASIGGGYKKQA